MKAPTTSSASVSSHQGSGFVAQAAFTLVELLAVVVIIALLASMAMIGFNRAIMTTYMSGSINNVKGLVNAAHNWATDNGGKLPSPQYPGDYSGGGYPVSGDTPKESIPAYWDLGGSGLWLDGVLYAQVYVEEDGPDITSLSQFGSTSGPASAGMHLVGTAFESIGSTKLFPSEKNWYRHSFAMNANLQYDGLHAETGGGGRAWLTEKTLGNLAFQTNAMLFIDCMEQNVVMAEDVQMIRDAAERNGGKHIISGFLDGHVDKLKVGEIPDGDINSDMDASRFWRGVREE